MLIILSGPSGAGEDSIIEELEKRMDIDRVITTTTRNMRPNESEGNPYYFISKEKFKKGIESENFFEWAEHYNGNLYGVTNEEIERAQNENKIIIWKIDYKGVIDAKNKIPEIFSILISAPLDVLEKRIRKRDNIDEEYIKERMEYSREWMKHKNIYDVEVENVEGKLEETVDKIEALLKAKLN